MISGVHFCNPGQERAFRRFHQTRRRLRDSSDANRKRRVADKAVERGSHVDGDNVTFL